MIKNYIYGFDTESTEHATAALLVYAVYRSRDIKRFKVSVDMWSQIERFTKASAKRAKTLSLFLESFKPKLCCESIKSKWMDVGLRNDLSLLIKKDDSDQIDSIVEVAGKDEQRAFLTLILREANDKVVIEKLYKETTYVIMLVRERLERERPVENKFELEI